MKKIIFFLPVAALFFIACNNNKPKDTTIISKDGSEKITIDPNAMEHMAADMEKKKEELSKMTPMTLEELKALLPATLLGAERTDLDASNAMGTGLASARYRLTDSSHMQITIYDCAGPAGAGIYSMQYLGLWNIQQDTETEYTKTIDYNGGKAFEHCNKKTYDCTFTYFSSGRLLAVIEGDNLGMEQLKQAAGGLGLKNF